MKNKYIFLCGRTASTFGTQIYNFVFALLILYTTGSAVNYAITLILEIIPRIFFSSLAGVVADKYERKKIIVLSDILCALILFIAFGVWNENTQTLLLIYIVTFLLNSINSFFDITLTASLDQLFKNDELQKMCSINECISSFIYLIAPTMGALFYSIVNFKYFLLLNGLSFLLSAFAEMKLEFKNNTIVSENIKLKAELISTISYIKKQRVILLLYTAAIFINIFYGLGVSLSLPIVLTTYLKFTEIQYSIINVILSIGMIIGAYIVGNLKIQKRYKIIIFSLLAEAICINLFYLPNIINWKIQWFYFIAIVSFILGFAVSMLNITVRVLMQEIIPSNIKGKVLGTLSTFCLSISPIVLTLGGRYIDSNNPYAVIIFSGIGFMGLNVILMMNKNLKKV